MTGKQIAERRMRNTRLWGSPLDAPEDVVGWLGAVQSQEFAPAKWSIAQRATGLTDGAIDEAFNEGRILRTHVLRPTWHFVLPTDIRWMLELTAPRVRRQMAYYDRMLGLDGDVTPKASRIIAKALSREGHLTRKDLSVLLEKNGVEAKGQRLGHLVMNVELDGVICSGGPRGKQQTYALLDERAPETKRLNREEALAELTVRYFTGHGPATVKDFGWWSSLTLTEIRRGIETARSQLEREVIDGVDFWFSPTMVPRRPRVPRAHLLQPYDEYIVGYKESRYSLDLSELARQRFPEVFGGVILIDSQVVGHYKRALSKDSVVVSAVLFRPVSKSEMGALRAEVRRLGEFLGLSSELKCEVESSPSPAH